MVRSHPQAVVVHRGEAELHVVDVVEDAVERFLGAPEARCRIVRMAHRRHVVRADLQVHRARAVEQDEEVRLGAAELEEIAIVRAGGSDRPDDCRDRERSQGDS